MTSLEMHSFLLAKMGGLKPDFEMHPLYKAMLMECCENVVTEDNNEK
jgi:hypothetical protein